MADLAQCLALIETVQGIGRRTGLSLLIRMPKLGRLTRAGIASLAGLAPFDRDSGQYHGQRRIAGGRHRVRRALYAAALPAGFRWNPTLIANYKCLRASGKNHKPDPHRLRQNTPDLRQRRTRKAIAPPRIPCDNGG